MNRVNKIRALKGFFNGTRSQIETQPFVVFKTLADGKYIEPEVKNDEEFEKYIKSLNRPVFIFETHLTYK
jgi:hypothetical protein